MNYDFDAPVVMVPNKETRKCYNDFDKFQQTERYQAMVRLFLENIPEGVTYTPLGKQKEAIPI
jgi:hypothetical protein